MKLPFFPRPPSVPAPLAIIDTLRDRNLSECFSATAMVISTEPNNNELSTLLLRCRTMEEVKLLAFAYYLRAVSEGGLVVLTDEKNKVAAQAWLFD